MIEPTETESQRTMDEFIEAIKEILKEYKENPDHVLHAPYTLPVKRVDEVSAARNPDLMWK